MTFEEFIARWTGKPIDFDGVYPNQCMDLMHQYVYDVLGIKDKAILAHPLAYQVYTNFTESNLFEKIANTLTNIPQRGDIFVFGASLNGGAGHVSIVTEANILRFKSFDANFPTGSLPHIQQHDYKHALGWLKFKAQTPIDYKKLYENLKFQYEKLNSIVQQAKTLLNTV